MTRRDMEQAVVLAGQCAREMRDSEGKASAGQVLRWCMDDADDQGEGVGGALRLLMVAGLNPVDTVLTAKADYYRAREAADRLAIAAHAANVTLHVTEGRGEASAYIARQEEIPS